MSGARAARRRTLMALLALVSVASACGSDDSGASSPSAEPGIDVSASTATETSTTDASPNDTAQDAAPKGVEPEGFSTISAIITDADGVDCEICLWLADTPEQRGRGLMGVTDLGDADGMAFRFPEPTTGAFYMFQTPTPLSIAWFASDGDLVGTADMAPCLETPAGECPRYAPDDSYDLALEVFEGGLEPLGIGPGVHLEVIDGSESDRCPIG